MVGTASPNFGTAWFLVMWASSWVTTTASSSSERRNRSMPVVSVTAAGAE